MVIYHYDEVSNIDWIATQNSPDTDVDGTPNFVDPDDDNDGISDYREQETSANFGDSDGDGIFDVRRADGARGRCQRAAA